MKLNRLLLFMAPLVPLCACGLWLRGCANEHSRPHGHGDITFDISKSGDTIVFSAVGKGGRDLYLLQFNDLRVSRIAETSEYEVDPSFSPDGKAVVYAAGIPGDRADHLFIRSLDGMPPRQLTRGDVNDTSPRFSPDGASIVFVCCKEYRWGGLGSNWSGGGVLCIIGIDGTTERQITPDDYFAYLPRFSADGKSILHSTSERLVSVAVDGSATRLEAVGLFRAVPSLDGKLLAYCKGEYSPDLRLYVANSDGTGERLVSQKAAACSHPIFSSEGDHLYFFREEWPDGPTGEPKFSLWQVGIDGSDLHMVADSRLFDEPLAWKPKAAR